MRRVYDEDDEEELPPYFHTPPPAHHQSPSRPHPHPHSYISISLTIQGSPRFQQVAHSAFAGSSRRQESESSLSYEDSSSEESSPALEMEQQSYLSNLGEPDSSESQWDENRESPFFAGVREGMTEVEIAGLPSMRWGKNHERFNGGEKCSVCMEQFEVGQMMRVMPSCLHRYHALCLDPWLKLRASCPVCRTACVVEPQQT